MSDSAQDAEAFADRFLAQADVQALVRTHHLEEPQQANLRQALVDYRLGLDSAQELTGLDLLEDFRGELAIRQIPEAMIRDLVVILEAEISPSEAGMVQPVAERSAVEQKMGNRNAGAIRQKPSHNPGSSRAAPPCRQQIQLPYRARA
jgi:hypothetical protein